MNDCIFCKIVEEELPSYKVYEDELFLGFLDIFPLNPGHCVLIPKKHYRWVYDVPEFGAYWEAAKKLGLAIMKAEDARSINYLTIGEEVPHAHIWIIPRYENDGEKIEVHRLNRKMESSEMVEIASKISSQLTLR